MDNKEQDLQEIALEDILKEFCDGDKAPLEEVEAVFAAVEADGLPKGEEKRDTIRLERIGDAKRPEMISPERPAEQIEKDLDQEPAEQMDEESEEESLEDIPVEIQEDSQEEASQEELQPGDVDETKVVPQEEEEKPPVQEPIPFRTKDRLRELKRKLVAGPERRYYELTELGVGKLQGAIFANLLILLASAAMTILFDMEIIPAERLRLVVFSQVLGLMLSGLLSCYCMMDGVAQIFRGRFSVDTMLALTFLACCVDGIFCLQQQRVPCCAAFCLEATFALWRRYQKRSTEMGQMDTLRKANRLFGITRIDDYYEGKPGLVRSQGEVEHFMDNYDQTSGPERIQMLFSFVAFLACVGIAVFAGMLRGLSVGVQIFATSLLVATPASFFVSLTRPMAVLERRLHMVGTVLCGWKGIKRLCGKAAFPISDEDLFPEGSIKPNGVKFYGDRDPDQILAYAAALIRAAGGSLEPIFEQLLKNRSGARYEAENLRHHTDGGIGGEVWGESVLMGSPALLEQMGVEIPEGTMVNQAVYCAIDGQLCAVFAITYSRMRSSAAGMVTLCAQRKLTPVVVSGDFMLTDVFIKSKFGVNTRRMAFPTLEQRQAMVERRPEEGSEALALTTQDTLSATAYGVTGARALRSAWKAGLALHMIGGILGMGIMVALAVLGATQLLTPVHVLLYQLVWMIPGLLISELTRSV